MIKLTSALGAAISFLFFTLAGQPAQASGAMSMFGGEKKTSTALSTLPIMCAVKCSTANDFGIGHTPMRGAIFGTQDVNTHLEFTTGRSTVEFSDCLWAIKTLGYCDYYKRGVGGIFCDGFNVTGVTAYANFDGQTGSVMCDEIPSS